MSVANSATFGLLAGTISDGAEFSNVTISGKVIIGDNCAELAQSSESYTMGKVCGSGEVNGINHDISVEKADPENSSFTITVADDGTISILPGSN